MIEAHPILSVMLPLFVGVIVGVLVFSIAAMGRD